MILCTDDSCDDCDDTCDDYDDDHEVPLWISARSKCNYPLYEIVSVMKLIRSVFTRNISFKVFSEFLNFKRVMNYF